ncbi:MAG: hypothetical protein CSA94_01650 [Bacteroidetes bacterium]|nr:MAG: hypothetical protein CSA94_01650 [Bacteroidota bacterium]
MLKYGFIENVDYWEILPINSEQGKEFTSKMTETPKGFYSKMSKTKRGRPAKEYILSLDCAKSIAMLQRNERGKRTRQYFLLCEKKAHQQGNEQIEALQAELAIYRRMEQINSLRRKLNAEMRILKEQLSSIIPVQLKLAL